MIFDEEPNKCYLMLRNSILKSDKGMFGILERIKMYTLRQTLTVTGIKYKIGDFILKVGSIMMINSTRGLVIELEYLPSIVPNSCLEIFQEFFDGLLPQEKITVSSINYAVEIAPPIPETYSLTHATHQYVHIFKNILKSQ